MHIVANNPPSHASLRGLLPSDMPGVPVRTIDDSDRDRHFVTMLRAFRETGGLARGDEVAELLTARGTGDVSRLARWIVTRQVISFDWRGELWVPLFQFDLSTTTLRQETRQLSAELSPVMDGWDVSVWCATPLAALGGRVPAEIVGSDFGAVLMAAREFRDAQSVQSAVS